MYTKVSVARQPSQDPLRYFTHPYFDIREKTPITKFILHSKQPLVTDCLQWNLILTIDSAIVNMVYHCNQLQFKFTTTEYRDDDDDDGASFFTEYLATMCGTRCTYGATDHNFGSTIPPHTHTFHKKFIHSKNLPKIK